MKALFMSILLVLSAKALAVGPITTTTTTTTNLTNDVSAKDLSSAKISTRASDLDLDNDGIKYNTTEAGFEYSSINNGSAFANVAIIHEFQNGFAMGVRGMMPLNYSNDLQIYQGQILGRFILLNEVTQMNLEPSITQVLVSDDNGTHPFAMFGLSYGVMRQIKPDLAVGGQIGVDYADSRLSHDEIRSNTNALYNRISFNGSYSF